MSNPLNFPRGDGRPPRLLERITLDESDTSRTRCVPDATWRLATLESRSWPNRFAYERVVLKSYSRSANPRWWTPLETSSNDEDDIGGVVCCFVIIPG